MQFVLFLIVLGLVAISVIRIVVIRIRLKKQAQIFTEKIKGISAYREKEKIYGLGDTPFIDIPTDLADSFKDVQITARQEKNFKSHYAPYYREAHALVKKLKTFKLPVSSAITNLMGDFENISKLVRLHNDAVIHSLLAEHKGFHHTDRHAAGHHIQTQPDGFPSGCVCVSSGCFRRPSGCVCK